MRDPTAIAAFLWARMKYNTTVDNTQHNSSSVNPRQWDLTPNPQGVTSSAMAPSGRTTAEAAATAPAARKSPLFEGPAADIRTACLCKKHEKRREIVR